MTTPARFPYAAAESGRPDASLLAYLPITLRHQGHSVPVSGLLDTGSTVNVLPYSVGLQLGLVWEEETTPVHLTGNLAKLPARAVIASGQVESFPPVELAFAWTQSTEVPVILGQVNFFMEFDVCFFRSQSAFEVTPKGT
ncbi:MAG: aspartyl protease family protein [Anaerolineae bacterium]